MNKINTAIIVAAGSGQRFGGQTPKQFLAICGKPLLIHTLQRFQDCPEIDSIILVLSSSHIAEFLQLLAEYDITKIEQVISGGKTRAESVRNGLNAISPKSANLVAVHDGARPLVTNEEIRQCLFVAKETGAAIVVAPLTDTIKAVKNGKIVSTIDRNSLRRALTPQCFKFDLMKQAFAETNDLSEATTDESKLVERLGIAVSCVEGSARNIKVTTPEDFILAEALLKQNV